MERIESFELVLTALKERAILTTNGKNRFYLVDGKIVCHINGSSYKLNLDDFKAVHQKDVFYIFEDKSVFIDNDKDDAYYRYYKK